MFEYSDEAIQRLIKGVYNGEISEYNLPEGLYNAIAKYFRRGLYDGFGMTLADAAGKDMELLTELRENVYMFSAAKTYQQTKELQSLLIDDEGNLRTAREFNKLGKQTFELWNGTWGTTEYNTCVGQAQQASKWNEIEANKEALPLLRYSAVMDPNTSEICAPLNGIVAPVDDKIWNRIAPLNHFNCRCVLLQEESGKVTPESEKLKAVKEVEENMQDVFKMNPGKDGYIFKDDHPYFEVAAKDKGFARENFGLPIPPADDDKIFKGAKTIAEAKQRMVSVGVKNPAIDDWGIDHANQMLRAVETVPKKAIPTVITDKKGFESLVATKIKRKEKEWQGLSMNTEIYDKAANEFRYEKFVVINTKGYKTPELMTAKKVTYNEFYSGVKPGSKWYFNQFDGSTHFHELGHVYDNGVPTSTKQDWIDIADKWHKETSIDMIKVSAGGDFRGKNGSEAFAEAFASYFGNNKKGLPGYVIDYFDKNVK